MTKDENELAVYRALGSVEDIAKAFRTVMIFRDYINVQPANVRSAWQTLLRQKKAL